MAGLGHQLKGLVQPKDRYTHIAADSRSHYEEEEEEEEGGGEKQEEAADALDMEEEDDLMLQCPDLSLPANCASVSQKASLAACTINLANSVMGAGILGLPFAIHSTGPAFGPALFVMVALMSAFTMYLLVEAGATAGVASYEELVEKAYGQGGRKLFSLLLVVSISGVLTAYIVLLADFLTPVLCPWVASLSMSRFSFMASRPFIMTWVVALGVLPLCSLRNLASLRFASALSMLLMFLLALVLLHRSFYPFDPVASLQRPGPQFLAHRKLTIAWNHSAFSGMPIITFAFSCHVCIFPVYNSLELPTPGRMCRVIAGALGLCACIYGCVVVLGYSLFRDSLCPNLLNNFAAADPLVGAVRLAFTFAITTTYPFALFAARRSLDMLLFPAAASQGFSASRFMAETLALVSLSLSLAILAPGVRIVFALSGAVFATMIAYVIPTMCYVRLSSAFDLHCILSMLILWVALMLGGVSTWANIKGVFLEDPTPLHCRAASHCLIQYPKRNLTSNLNPETHPDTNHSPIPYPEN